MKNGRNVRKRSIIFQSGGICSFQGYNSNNARSGKNTHSLYLEVMEVLS
jgi:hypothetical protein